MKKIISFFMSGLLLLAVIGCGSNETEKAQEARPVGGVLGKEILALCVELGKAKNIDCAEALKNKEITAEAAQMAGGSLESYNEWIQKESGQKAMQAAIEGCTAN